MVILFTVQILLSLQKPFKIKGFIVFQMYFQINFFLTFNLIARNASVLKKKLQFKIGQEMLITSAGGNKKIDK